MPINHTEGSKTILHILNEGQVRFLFIYSSSFTTELVTEREQLPLLVKTILLVGELEDPQVSTLAEFLSLADKTTQEKHKKNLAAGAPTEIATLVYPSGTTEVPRGEILTQDNILSNAEACCHLIQISYADECLSFLPLSHIY